MKHKITLLTLLLSFFFVNCISSNEDSAGTNSKIVGSWIENDIDPDLRKDQIWTFRSDGTFTSERFYKADPTISAYYANGDYSIDQDNLKLTFKDGMEFSGGVWHEDGKDSDDSSPMSFTVKFGFNDKGDLTMQMEKENTYSKTEERTRTN